MAKKKTKKPVKKTTKKAVKKKAAKVVKLTPKPQKVTDSQLLVSIFKELEAIRMMLAANLSAAQSDTVAELAPVKTAAPVEAPAVVASWTKADLEAALTALVAAKGVSEAQKLLQEFGAERLAALPEAKWGDFIDRCQAEAG